MKQLCISFTVEHIDWIPWIVGLVGLSSIRLVLSLSDCTLKADIGDPICRRFLDPCFLVQTEP